MPQASPDDDLPFQHYTRQHRVIAWISQNVFDHFTYTVKHGLLKGMKRKGGLGWIPESFTKASQTKEEEFWRGLDLSGLTVFDVGAFQGLLTLFFARQAARVICYEPNTNNYNRLTANIGLNGLSNVRVRKVGVGSQAQTAQMVYSPLMPGGASVEPNEIKQLRHSAGPSVTEDIEITTLDSEVFGNLAPAPGFIKIDIEGWEIEALKGARRTLTEYKPALFLEMHGATMNQKRAKIAEIVAFLEGVGYRDILHVESGAAISGRNSDVAAEGHLYCRAES